MRTYVLSSLLLVILLFSISSMQAQSSKVRQLEKKKGHILSEIERTNKSLERIKQTGIEEAKKLELINQRVRQRQEVISVIGEEMSALNVQIDSLSGKLQTLRAKERSLLTQYEMSARAMYNNELTRKRLIYLLASETVDNLRIRQHILNRYAKTTKDLAKELGKNKKDIEVVQAEVNLSYKKKNEALQLHNQEKQKLEEEQDQHRVKIKRLKGQEDILQRDLRNQSRQAERLDAQIQAQIQAEIAAATARAKKAEDLRLARERREARRKKKNGSVPVDRNGSDKANDKSSRDVDEQKKELVADDLDRPQELSNKRGGYMMNNQDLKLSGSFVQNKGKLPPPVRGKYDLVTRFGKRPHHKFKSLMVNHSGIELRVSSDRGAYSVFDGTVMHVFVASGYGQGVLLRHGNYFTVYVNLSNVSVRTGQKVSAGTRLGTINSDQSSQRANILHFQLRHNDNKLNPEQWINL